MATIVTRSGKGSALTFAEGDANFTNLNNDKLENINSESIGDLSDVDLTGNADNYILVYDTASNSFKPEAQSGGGTSDVVDDTTPQLGGDLDLNSNDITGSGDVNITGTVVAQSTINAQTGFTYTAVIGDASKLITMTNSIAQVLTIPPNSSVAFPVGTKLDMAQLGAGQLNVTPGSGVTVHSNPTLKLRAQYSGATCIKIATDTWLLVGDLASS